MAREVSVAMGKEHLRVYDRSNNMTEHFSLPLGPEVSNTPHGSAREYVHELNVHVLP